MSSNINVSPSPLAGEGWGEGAQATTSQVDNIAIRVENLSKCYTLYDAPRDRLRQFILPRLQRIVGKPPRNYYREFWALKDISFEIRKGETVGIIGRNGSGKSTLLQIICGTLTPTSGTVETSGRIAALLELGSGFNPEFTGRENIYMNAAVLGLSKEEVDKRFDDIAAFADIGQFIEQPVKTYSSGMFVRLAFALQAMVDPDILVVDEALAVGDERFQRKCFARLEELKNKGTSILFVSHSGPQIVELCERALLLEHGIRLVYTAAPQVVRAYQKLIYAPITEQERLILKFRAADQSGQDVESLGTTELPYASGNNNADAFDLKLKPETTIKYSVQGAEVESIQIHNTKGRAVNVLSPGQDYKFLVSGKFVTDTKNVYFGIHIRSVSGIVIAGQRHPEEGQYIERVRAGESFRMSFGFRMVLLPGTYFVGGGVWSNQEPTCLHRILDALMFCVVPYGKSISFGYVDASSNEPALEIF